MNKIPLQELNFNDGALLLIDKPYGNVSFGIVHQLKKWTKAKIGHAGTLDPLASGLLILCTGKWTKKLTELTGQDKTYEGIICLGATTKSYDLENSPENVKDISSLTEEKIIEASKNFVGEIIQYPPVYSAVKQDGKRLYESARAGEEIKIRPRTQHVFSFEILKVENADVHFKLHCSSGTYVRSIANDMGEILGCGGYLKKLVRTKIGNFELENAYSMDEMRSFFGSAAKLTVIEPKDV